MRRPSDLQIYYQRNMIYAMLLMSLGILILTICFFEFSPNELEIINHKNQESLFVQTKINNDSPKKSEPISAKNILPKFNPYAGIHDGFLGFRSIKISNSEQIPISIAQPIFSYENTIDVTEDSQFSFSKLEGENIGTYVSDNGDDDFAFGIPKISESSFNRKIEVLRQVNPVYPWVAKQSGKEGKSSVLLYIDSEGYIADFPDWFHREGIKKLSYEINGKIFIGEYIVTEEPADWFFAKNFIDVLPMWRFSPHIQRGKPISAFIRINYTFCLTYDCVKYKLEEISPSSKLTSKTH